MIDIPSGISSQIPGAVLRRLDSLDQLTQEAFLTEFQKEKKSGFVAFLLWCVFPAWHYFYIGKVWLNLLFWLTFGGIGFWWVIDLFRLPSLVREHNKTVAIGVLKEIEFLN